MTIHEATEAAYKNGDCEIKLQKRLPNLTEEEQRVFTEAICEAYNRGKRDALRWIPVTERLPNPKRENYARDWYIVALLNGVVRELAYEFTEDSVFGYGWRETAYPVTHWMEKPAPPKEGE